MVSGAAPDFRQSLLGRQPEKQFLGDHDHRRPHRRRYAFPIAADAGATIMLSNHSEFDAGYLKARMISTMMPGEDNPFAVSDGVQRYHTVLIECAEAEKARLMEGEDVPST